MGCGNIVEEVINFVWVVLEYLRRKVKVEACFEGWRGIFRVGRSGIGWENGVYKMWGYK